MGSIGEPHIHQTSQGQAVVCFQSKKLLRGANIHTIIPTGEAKLDRGCCAPPDDFRGLTSISSHGHHIEVAPRRQGSLG